MPQPMGCFEGTKFHQSNKCAGQAPCSEAMWHRSAADHWECVISAAFLSYSSISRAPHGQCPFSILSVLTPAGTVSCDSHTGNKLSISLSALVP